MLVNQVNGGVNSHRIKDSITDLSDFEFQVSDIYIEDERFGKVIEDAFYRGNLYYRISIDEFSQLCKSVADKINGFWFVEYDKPKRDSFPEGYVVHFLTEQNRDYIGGVYFDLITGNEKYVSLIEQEMTK